MCNVSKCEYESINGCALIFGTNQKQWKLVHKELGIHNNTFAAIQLPTIGQQKPQGLAGEFWTIYQHPPCFVNSSRHMYPLGTYLPTSHIHLVYIPFFKPDFGFPLGFSLQSRVPEHILIDHLFVQTDIHRVPERT